MPAGNMISSQSVICRKDNTVSTQIDDKLLMMNLISGEYLELDAIGSLIWQEIETPQTVASICEMLVQKYSVSEEKCHEDVVAFLNELNMLELLSEK